VLVRILLWAGFGKLSGRYACHSDSRGLSIYIGAMLFNMTAKRIGLAAVCGLYLLWQQYAD
jgi:hypothetical protein